MCVAVTMVLLRRRNSHTPTEGSGRFASGACMGPAAASDAAHDSAPQTQRPSGRSGCSLDSCASPASHKLRGTSNGSCACRNAVAQEAPWPVLLGSAWGRTAGNGGCRACQDHACKRTMQKHTAGNPEHRTVRQAGSHPCEPVAICKSGAHSDACSESRVQASRLPCVPREQGGSVVTKDEVRQALASVCQWYPAARPTRPSLKQVYQFIRGREGAPWTQQVL